VFIRKSNFTVLFLLRSKTDAELKEDKIEQISNELNSIYELILKGKSLNESITNKSSEFMKSMSNIKREDTFTQTKKWIPFWIHILFENIIFHLSKIKKD
jgi:hypothetical protein